jgi:hypothetical protein
MHMILQPSSDRGRKLTSLNSNEQTETCLGFTGTGRRVRPHVSHISNIMLLCF